MARRSQCSSAEDNPLDPNYLHPHYREEYRLAVDALVENDLDGYYEFLQSTDVVDFLSRPEIEHIKSTVQGPRHMDRPGAVCQGDETAEGSSDTYWPMHSDLEAPSLDLGWPEQLQFVGPTEIITFVNPPDPAMPSIKTQARRLIKDAQLVIAVAMDVFTDIDIFADLLEATKRNVAVYILLDEQNAHHFTAMVVNCGVNLDQIKCMRVRTVAGINYYCRSGKSFKGQMMDRFMLIDSRAVLGGNYSFMWSFEKLHRCLAHLFLGQLVVTFDEEFRILYAQSEPLVVESAVVPIQKYSSMPELQKTHKVYPRKSKEYLTGEGTYNTEWPGPPYEGRMDMDPKMFPLRRGESAQLLLPSQANMPPAQQYRTDRLGAFGGNMFRRSSYGEGTPGGYYQQYLMHRERQNMDALETQSTHSHRDQHHYERTGREPIYDPADKFRIQRYQHSDQYSEPGGQPTMDQVDSYDHVLKFLQSNPSVEMEQGSEKLMVPEGPYAMSGRRRQRFGQPYACQTSPTQLSPHEQKRFHMELAPERKSRDPAAKKGLRDWRIHSYLSAYDDAASDDMPQLQGSDIGDDSPFSSQERLCDLDPLAPRAGHRELGKMPSAALASRQKKHFQTDDMKNYPSVQTVAKSTLAATSESSCTTESEKAADGEDKPPDATDATKDEPVQRRPNPTLHRASRLRNSLLFSSNLEQHRSLYELAKSTDLKDESPKIVEKSLERNPLKKQSTAPMGEEPRPVELPTSHLQRTSSFIVDMNDPDSRLQFFKQLAAQRKAEAVAKTPEGILKQPSQEADKIVSSGSDGSNSAVKQEQTSEVSHKSTKTELQSSKATKDKIPIITVHVSDSDTKLVESLSPTDAVPPEMATSGQTHDILPQIATDAEKIELKRLQEPAIARSVPPSHSSSSKSSSVQQSESQNVLEAPLGSNLKEKSLDAPHDSGKKEFPVMPSAIISESPPSSKPVLPVISGEPETDKITVETTDCLSTASSEKAAEVASVGTMESGETKKELVQKRPKPSLQKASKLRNSLLFSSNLEQHQSQWEKDSSGQNKTDDHSHRDRSNQSQDLHGKRGAAPAIESTSFKRQASFTMGEASNQDEFQSKVLQRTTAMLNLSDPDSRLQFFRELAAQRKSGRTAAVSAESTTGQNSQKPDETEDTFATEGNVSVPEPCPLDSLSKPLPTTESNAEAPQVLDDDTKTAQSAPEKHAGKDLSENSGQCQSSRSATDTEKMEQMKLNVEAPAKLPFATSTSSALADSSSAIKDIPKDAITSCEDQASKKQILHSDASTKQAPAYPSALNLQLSPGKTTHRSTSPAISVVEDTQEDTSLNPTNKPFDSDASSVCSSVEMGSGTEFATAPSSPCTPTPTELFPLPQKEKNPVLTTAAETLVPSLSSSAKTPSPQRISSTNPTSELEKCSSASHSLPTKPCASSPAKCNLETEAISTEPYLPPMSSPSQSPTGDSHRHTSVKISAQGPVLSGDIPSSQSALLTSDNSTVESPKKTDYTLASVSSPTKPCLTAVVSPTQSKLPHDGHSTQTSTVHSTNGSSKTKQNSKSKHKSKNRSSSISSPLKSTPTKMDPSTKLSSAIKITDTSSVSSSVQTEDSPTVLDAIASPGTSIVDSLTITDSSLSPASSTTETSPMTNIAPKESSFPETTQSETSTNMSEETSSSPYYSPQKNIPVVEVFTEGSSTSDDDVKSGDLVQKKGSLTLNITQLEGCSSPTAKCTLPKEAEVTTESSSQLPSTSSPSTKSVPMSPTVSSVDSPTKTQSHPVSSPINTSPVVEVSPKKIMSPHDVKKLVSSPLLQLIQTDSPPPIATTDSHAKPMASASSVTASPGPETPNSSNYPNTEQPTSPPALSVLGDSCNSELSQAAPTLPTEESSFNEAITEGALESDAKDTCEDRPAADMIKLSEESPADESGATTSQSTKEVMTSPSVEDSKERKSESTKDAVTSPGTEDPKEQKSQSTKGSVTSPSTEDKEQKSPTAEPSKSPPSRYQSSTASVLSCSNLRDDTKVLLEQISANSQSRAAKQSQPDTDDAKGDEVKGPDEKSKRNSTKWNSHMSDMERDRLITAMESKRKERRVYSRFEAL